MGSNSSHGRSDDSVQNEGVAAIKNTWSDLVLLSSTPAKEVVTVSSDSSRRTFSKDDPNFVDPADLREWSPENDFGDLSPDDEGEGIDLGLRKDGQPPTKKRKSTARSY